MRQGGDEGSDEGKMITDSWTKVIRITDMSNLQTWMSMLKLSVTYTSKCDT